MGKLWIHWIRDGADAEPFSDSVESGEIFQLMPCARQYVS